MNSKDPRIQWFKAYCLWTGHSEIVFQKLLDLYKGEKGNFRKLEEVNRSKKGSYASAIDTKVIGPWALAFEVSLSKVLPLKIALKVHLWCLNEWLTWRTCGYCMNVGMNADLK